MDSPERTQGPKLPEETSQRAINTRIVVVALSIPLVVAFGLNAMVIGNFLDENAQAVLTWTGVVLTLTGGLAFLRFWMELLELYDNRGSKRNEEKVEGILEVALMSIPMISGGIVLILRANIWDATGAAVTNAGTLAMLTGLVTIFAESEIARSRQMPSITRLGQLLAIAGAVLISVGIIILCRTQLG